jgi:hypothetical protein
MIELLLQAEGALSLGLLDRAETLYRQVAGADPRNSIAVVGLARVALERGDEPGALAQARRALAIDGENAAAQRLVQRLEEVLAFRGVAPRAEPEMAPTPEPPVTARPAEASTALEPAPAPELQPAPEPQPAPAPEHQPAPASALEPPAIAEPHRRSLVDRLLRRR